MSTLTLVRHGQASFGKSDYDQLSDTGFAQAQRLGEALLERGETIDAVYIGGMLRHRQTAERCLSAMGLDLPLHVLPDFNEFDHVQILERFEPRYRDRAWIASEMAKHASPEAALIQVFKAATQRWVSGQHSDYDESWSQFQQRVLAGLDSAITPLAPKQHALVFTSGGCISVIAQTLLELSDHSTFRTNWILANCGLTRIVQGSQRNLSSLNEYGHFSGRHQPLLTYR
jgi:broad specificity phosphatase PhoE